jgi:Flp pilus assembly protein TadG
MSPQRRLPARPTRRNLERGGVAALVAILLGTGVLIGMSALTLDVGSIWFERRQLQNSADAASMALAEQCAVAAGNCAKNSPVIATYSNLNVKDGSSSNDGACGRFAVGYAASTAGGPWTTCPSATDTSAENLAKAGSLPECLPLPSWLTGTGATIPYVEVKVGTARTGTTASPLPGIFSRAVSGNENPHVTSCARAAWGPPSGYTGSFPIAISVCEFVSYTGTDALNGIPGAAVGPPTGPYPGYGGPGQDAWPDPYSGWPNKVQDELYVMTHTTGGTHCTFKGKDTDGGFGWLESGTNCSTTVSTSNNVDYWAQIGTGNNVPTDCKTVLDNYYGKPLLGPIFDCLLRSGSLPTGGIASLPTCTESGGGGGTTWYHILGFATFYLSGNKLTNSTAQNSKINNVMPCSPTSPTSATTPNPWTGQAGRCISGWFVSSTLTASSIAPGGGSADLGTVAVAPAG